jgi:hypothetical protein
MSQGFKDRYYTRINADSVTCGVTTTSSYAAAAQYLRSSASGSWAINTIQIADLPAAEAWTNINAPAGGGTEFQNSWENYNVATHDIAQFRKNQLGEVVVKGLVKNGVIGSAVFTLPANYRPSKHTYFPSVAFENPNWDFSLIYVDSNGDVIVYGTTYNDAVTLTSIRFTP